MFAVGFVLTLLSLLVLVVALKKSTQWSIRTATMVLTLLTGCVLMLTSLTILFWKYLP